MIQVHVTPVGVERVLIVCGSPLEEDFDLACWQAIRPLVDRIDRRLRRAARTLRNSREPARQRSLAVEDPSCG